MLTPFKVFIRDSFLMFILISTDDIPKECAALEVKFQCVVDHTNRTIDLL